MATVAMSPKVFDIIAESCNGPAEDNTCTAHFTVSIGTSVFNCRLLDVIKIETTVYHFPLSSLTCKSILSGFLGSGSLNPINSKGFRAGCKKATGPGKLVLRFYDPQGGAWPGLPTSFGRRDSAPKGLGLIIIVVKRIMAAIIIVAVVVVVVIIIMLVVITAIIVIVGLGV